ncbi:MAG: allantoate permease family MFS transporter [Ruminococcaceae bacterium]|nr:allantoate permease family MFS transporter [Oscillospiraceae bacterium]
MGRMLGSFADNQELDRPDLNKCPDCECFFAGDNCPLCGKECPENMRAGNRPVVKKKKQKRYSDSGRVTFVEWYHSWWFIIIMLFVMPIAGIILLITSPHKKSHKILFVILGIVLFIISTFGIGNIISNISDMLDPPVNTSLTKEEYMAKCEVVTPEQFYRSADGYKDQFVCVKLKVIKNVTFTDDFYNDRDYDCYLCEADNGSEYKIVIRDCLLADKQKFISGDVITVYGEGAGDCSVYDYEYNDWHGPCLNMAYVVLETE